MKEMILGGAVAAIPSILLGVAWWRWVVGDAADRKPTWRSVGMLISLLAGSASALVYYSTVAIADELQAGNRGDDLGVMYWGGCLLCFAGLVTAPCGKHEARILALFALGMLALFYALLLGPLLTAP